MNTNSGTCVHMHGGSERASVCVCRSICEDLPSDRQSLCVGVCEHARECIHAWEFMYEHGCENVNVRSRAVHAASERVGT